MNKRDKQILDEIQNLSERLAEDRLYEITANEIERDDYDPAAKARSFEEANGDQERARSLYIKHRVRRLKDLLAEEGVKRAVHEDEAERRELEIRQATTAIEQQAKPAKWRVLIAFVLDLVFSFFAIGYVVALVIGSTTETGFALSGFPALIAIALWIAYMAIMPRYGGRLFQRLFKAI